MSKIEEQKNKSAFAILENPLLSFTREKTRSFLHQELRLWRYSNFELQLWRYQIYKPQQVWSIFRMRDSFFTKQALFVRALCWRGYDAIKDPLLGTSIDISEVEVRDCLLNEKTLSAFRKKIESVAFKGIPLVSLVIDGGECFGIEYGINRLKWWGEGPEKWHKLTSLWNKIVDSLEDSLIREPLDIKTLEIDHGGKY